MATIILNATQLQAMETNKALDYELGSDIDATETSGWNGGAGFIPVGELGDDFTGSFDGKGYTVRNLFINRPDPVAKNTRCGLFGKTSAAAVVSNVTMSNVDITARQSVAAVVGSNYGSVTNCHSSGSVEGDRDGIGGIIGYNDDTGSYSLCSSSCTVDGRDEVGGFVGQDFGTGASSFATGVVTGTRNYAGGFAGTIEANASCQQCLATGNVNGDSYVGAFVGYSDYPIDNCYAQGNVVATTDFAGGFVGEYGYIDATSIINKSYSTGTVTCPGGNKGGFCGNLNGLATAVDCFWDTESSGEGASDGGTGKTTAEMKNVNTIQAAGWAISTIWSIVSSCNNGYPCLIGVNPCCGAVSPADQTIIGDKVSLEAIRNLEFTYGSREYVSKTGIFTHESRYHRNV